MLLSRRFGCITFVGKYQIFVLYNTPGEMKSEDARLGSLNTTSLLYSVRPGINLIAHRYFITLSNLSKLSAIERLNCGKSWNSFVK